MLLKPEFVGREEYGTVPKVMSVALITFGTTPSFIIFLKKQIYYKKQ